MKKIFSLFAAILFAGSMMAADGLVYTLVYANAAGTGNSYAGTYDVTIDGIDWNVPGNATMDPARIGGKNLAGVDRVLFSKTPLANNISKIEIEHGTAADITVNSMTVIVASDANFSNVISTLNPTFTAETVVAVERPEGKDWSNAYYKIVYNVTVEGNSNKFFQFKNAKFYGAGEPVGPQPVVEEWSEIKFDKAISKEALPADTVFADGNFKVAVNDPDNKMEIDGNAANFGRTDTCNAFAFRLKTGGKTSGTKNNIKVTVPADGLLRMAVRTGSNSDLTRTLILVQGTDTLYNDVVNENSKRVKPLTDSTSLIVYPYVFVNVKAGDIALTYPINGINFYEFGFLAGGEAPEVLADPKNCAEAAEAALSVSKNNEIYNDYKSYTIKGYVTEIATDYSEQYHNITFWMADTKDGGKVLEAYRAVCEVDTNAVIAGDLVEVTGFLTKYGTTPEFATGCTYKFIEKGPRPEPQPVESDTITCAKAAEDALAGKTDEVYVKGYVTEIVSEWSSQYKNVSFWMADAKDGGKVIEAFRAVCEKEADAPIVGDLVVAKGKLKDYVKDEVHTPELDAGCTFEIIEKTPRPEPKPTVIADTITVAKAIELGMALDSMATDTLIYAVEGYVINAGNISLTYKNQVWFMADEATATASDFEAYNCFAIEGNDTLKVLNGDKVQLVGKLKKYYNKNEKKFIIEIEKGNASFISKVEGDHSISVVTEEVTVAEALEIGKALADGGVTEKQYKITAYVSAINVKSSDAWSDQYGNQSFWVADDPTSTASTNADGAFYVYRGKPSTAAEIPVGAKVEFTCTIKKYVGSDGVAVIENADQNITVTVLEGPVGPELPEGVISCDSAVALAKTIQDPVEVKTTVEGPAVKVWGYVTYAYDLKDGKQSAWLSDTKGSNAGVIQGAYLAAEKAVEKGDYVQIEGTLAKYLKEGKDGKPNEVVIEVINGTIKLVSEIQGIENVVLTEKAQKVIVDGVLYIIRDNKMYNIQGLQVR